MADPTDDDVDDSDDDTEDDEVIEDSGTIDDREFEEDGGDDGEYDEPVDNEPIRPTSRPVRFARNSAAGAVLSGVALGLAEVLETKREEPPIVQVLPGEPPEPGWIDTDIDPLDPEASQVTVRPWLDDSAARDEARPSADKARDDESDAAS